jgi:class 3 adenylate cyclase
VSLSASFVTTTDGVRIAWSELGTGLPLVLVRGWITHLELTWAEPAFREFVTHLATHHRVVRFDTRGSGLSDREITYPGLDDLVLDVEAVIDALELDVSDRVVLWGSTFGGPIAIAYAARHPERVARMVLDGTYANGREAWPPERSRRISSLLSTVRDDPEAAYAALSYMTTPEPSTRHEQRVDRVMQSIAPDLLLYYYGLALDFDVRDDAAALECPTLVLHRRSSRVVPFDTGRALAASIPGARFVGLEGSGHNLWEDPTGPALRAFADFTGMPAPGRDALRATAQPGPAKPASGDPSLVTIMFTDIYASTALTGRLGDAAAHELVHFHDDAVNDALALHGGRSVKHTGDGILAEFPSASGALACATAIQERFDARNDEQPDSPLLVRIGLNAGEPIAERGDVFGTVVQLASRLCAAADPGEIVVANVVRELAAGKGFQFVDLGEADLRGFPEPVHRYALRREHASRPGPGPGDPRGVP